MPRVSRVATRARVQAIGLTLLAHAFLLMLVSVQRRASRDIPEPELQYVSLWPSGTQEQSVQAANTEQLATPVAPVRIPPREERTAQDRLAPVAPEPIEQAEPVNVDKSAVKSPVDWSAEVANAAGRIAEGVGKQMTFSAAPQALRKPCKARVFDEESKRLMEERLPAPADPDAVGADPKANCIIVGGYPKCVQKLVAKVRRRGFDVDLFKHRVEGRQPASSVPSSESCD
jgi:hypothetical protein